MNAHDERLPVSTAERWFIGCLLLGLPAAKTVTLLVEPLHVAVWIRQLVLGVVLATASFLLIRFASPISESLGTRWLIAVGLRSDPNLADDGRWRMVRWTIALAGLSLAIGVTFPQTGRGIRWVGAALAVSSCVAVAILEIIRRRSWSRHPSTGHPPDRRVLWTSAPLTLACSGTAAVLAVRRMDGVHQLGDFLELAVVTALGEEFLFRGCLLALVYRSWRPGLAQVVAAASFGLWHAGDSWMESAGQVGGARAAHLVGTFVVTFLGGLVFTFLRRRSHSLSGSVLAHIATNLPGRTIA